MLASTFATFMILAGLIAATACAMVQYPDEVVQFVSVLIQTLNAKALVIALALLSTPLAVVYPAAILRAAMNGVLVPLKSWGSKFIVSRIGSLAIDALLTVGLSWLSGTFVGNVLGSQFVPNPPTWFCVHSASLLFYLLAGVYTSPNTSRRLVVCFLSCVPTILGLVAVLEIEWFARNPILATCAHLMSISLVLLAAHLSSARKRFEQRAAPVDGGEKVQVQAVLIQDGDKARDSNETGSAHIQGGDETVEGQKPKVMRVVFKRRKPIRMSKERWLRVQRHQEVMEEAWAEFNEEERVRELAEQESAKLARTERSLSPPPVTPSTTLGTLSTTSETIPATPELTANKSSLPGSFNLLSESESSAEAETPHESSSSERDESELEEAEGVEAANDVGEDGEDEETGEEVEAEAEEMGDVVEGQNKESEVEEDEENGSGSVGDLHAAGFPESLGTPSAGASAALHQGEVFTPVVPDLGSIGINGPPTGAISNQEPVPTMEHGVAHAQVEQLEPPILNELVVENGGGILAGAIAVEEAPANIPELAAGQPGSPSLGPALAPIVGDLDEGHNLVNQPEPLIDHFNANPPAPASVNAAPAPEAYPTNPETPMDLTPIHAQEWNPTLGSGELTQPPNYATGYPFGLSPFVHAVMDHQVPTTNALAIPTTPQAQDPAPTLEPAPMDMSSIPEHQPMDVQEEVLVGEFGQNWSAQALAPHEPNLEAPGDEMDLEYAGTVDGGVPAQIEGMEIDEQELMDTPMGSPTFSAVGLPDTPMGSPVLEPIAEVEYDAEEHPTLDQQPPAPQVVTAPPPPPPPPRRAPHNRSGRRTSEATKSRHQFWAGSRPTKPNKPLRKRRAASSSAASRIGNTVPSLWLNEVFRAAFAEWEEAEFVPWFRIPHIPGSWMPRQVTSAVDQLVLGMQQAAIMDATPQVPAHAQEAQPVPGATPAADPAQNEVGAPVPVQQNVEPSVDEQLAQMFAGTMAGVQAEMYNEAAANQVAAFLAEQELDGPAPGQEPEDEDEAEEEGADSDEEEEDEEEGGEEMGVELEGGDDAAAEAFLNALLPELSGAGA